MRTQIINCNNVNQCAIIDTNTGDDVITFHATEQAMDVDVVYYSKFEGYGIDSPVWEDLIRNSGMTLAQIFVDCSIINDDGDRVLDTIALHGESDAMEETGCTMYINQFADGSLIYHLNDMIYTG